ncbi:MAG: hypothetical protein JXM68_05395, partial [Sedimentisphaerales bacterium]|nr:hypothetical protein [Sedimentisphaerales bacterium]
THIYNTQIYSKTKKTITNPARNSTPLTNITTPNPNYYKNPARNRAVILSKKLPPLSLPCHHPQVSLTGNAILSIISGLQTLNLL